jgi:hypothetical protein
VFHNTGYPFSVIDGATSEDILYYGGQLFAQQTATGFDNHCGGASHHVNPDGTGTSCAFASAFGTATGFGQSRRNQLFGPNFTDADLDITKGFKVPKWEAGSLKLGAQFFNTLNHPNFQLPYNNTLDGTQLGLIHSMASTPTSILGSFLGGDASPRLIQFKASFVF